MELIIDCLMVAGLVMFLTGEAYKLGVANDLDKFKEEAIRRGYAEDEGVWKWK
jgi:hypothetical protein